ncbi:MAG: isoprenylcysteine carboxylmethyltransferase family protein [Planctomycetota bacterium]|nr:isoprenylcysteine carboxylmethyltransferase family protein [Planctomycetota bacterium]
MRLRRRGVTRRAFMILLIALGKPTSETLFAAAVLMFVGWLINIVTYGVLEKKRKLVTTGPYAFVRNPFYVGTFLADVGMSIAANPSYLPVTLVCAFYFLLQSFFYANQIKREERDLLTLFGEEYRRYCENVPRLIPSFKSGMKNGAFRFSWSFDVALENRVFSRSFGAYLWLVFLWGLSFIGGKGEPLISGNLRFERLEANPVFLPIFVSSICIYGMFKVLEDVHKKERKKEREGVEFP